MNQESAKRAAAVVGVAVASGIGGVGLDRMVLHPEPNHTPVPMEHIHQIEIPTPRLLPVPETVPAPLPGLPNRIVRISTKRQGPETAARPAPDADKGTAWEDANNQPTRVPGSLKGFPSGGVDVGGPEGEGDYEGDWDEAEPDEIGTETTDETEAGSSAYKPAGSEQLPAPDLAAAYRDNFFEASFTRHFVKGQVRSTVGKVEFVLTKAAFDFDPASKTFMVAFHNTIGDDSGNPQQGLDVLTFQGLEDFYKLVFYGTEGADGELIPPSLDGTAVGALDLADDGPGYRTAGNGEPFGVMEAGLEPPFGPAYVLGINQAGEPQLYPAGKYKSLGDA